MWNVTRPALADPETPPQYLLAPGELLRAFAGFETLDQRSTFGSCAAEPFVDAERLAAVGFSWGGMAALLIGLSLGMFGVFEQKGGGIFSAG